MKLLALLILPLTSTLYRVARGGSFGGFFRSSLGVAIYQLVAERMDAALWDRILASRRGFEPPTCRLGGGCSIQLSYRDIQ